METTTRTFVADLVEAVGSLPTVAAQVVALAADPECDFSQLNKVILSDNAMTLRFMALANSAAVSFGREIKNLRGALTRLGLQRVRNVALLMGMHDMMPTGTVGVVLDPTEFWRHNLATASCARSLAWLRGLNQLEDAWLAGILHGIGVAALNQKAAPEFRRALSLAARQHTDLVTAEMQVFEFHHGELAGRVLREWNLPRIFADVVEFAPEDCLDEEVPEAARELVQVLRDAMLTARTIGYGRSGDADPLPTIDELSARLNLEEPAMAALAERVDHDVQEMANLIGVEIPADLFAAALAASHSEVARLGLAGLDDSLVREDLERQLTSAREIQQRLLPTALPEIPGCDLAATNDPSLHVSGDTYDCVRLRDGRLALTIADVSGKGMPAALLASTLQASLRALVRVFDDPGQLLGALNDTLYESTDPERFATFLLAVMNPAGDGFQYASAGHNPPLLLGNDGKTTWLKPTGTPLGMLPDMTYDVQEVAMAPGDLLVAYTDGITEALDPQGREFDESGLEATVRTIAEAAPAAVATHLIKAVYAHVSGVGKTPDHDDIMDRFRTGDGAVDAGDDLTLIVLRRRI